METCCLSINFGFGILKMLPMNKFMANLLQKRLLPATIALLLVCDFFILGNVAQAEVSTTGQIYANGSLLRSPRQQIFLIVRGEKHYISSLSELAWYRGRAIINVTDSVLLTYPNESIVKVKLYADGSLLKSPSGQIFLIANGFKHHILNSSELYTYRMKKIINVSDEVLLAYDDDTVVQSYGSGSLLRGSSDSIFLITDTRKYRIKNMTELAIYKNQKIFNVSDDVLSHYVTTLTIE